MTALEQTDSRPHLHVVGCVQCETWEQQVREMAQTITDLDRRDRTHLRRISQLEAELSRGLRDDPDHKLAERIFVFWQQQTGHKRAMFDTAREKTILHALKLVEKTWGDELAPKVLGAAVIGVARLGFTDPATGVKYDEIKLALRDAAMIEKNLRRYQVYMRSVGKEPAV